MGKEKTKYIYERYIYPNLPLIIYIFFYLIFFSPVLLSGKIIAPDDGLPEGYPNYYSPVALWTTNLFSGFPAFADPLAMRWYLPKIIFSFLKIPYSYFVIFPLIVASFLTYKLVYYLTKSKIAGFISGIIFGCNGFFIAHIGLNYMLQSGAWLPGILLGISKLKNEYTKKWYILTTFFVSLCILGGNPQIFTYSLIIVTLYILGNGLTKKEKKILYIGKCFSILLLGIGISCVQLLPTYELMKLSKRDSLPTENILSNSQTIPMLITLFFPYLLGNIKYNSFYLAQPKITMGIPESTGYVGISAIAFSIIGILKNKINKVDKQILFWMIICTLSLLLVLGENTNFGWIITKLPLINLFQVTSRNYFEFAISTSILAGYGLSYLEKEEYKKIKKIILWTIIIIITITIIALINIYLLKNELTKLLENTTPIWKNPAIWIPIIIALTTCAYIYFFKKIKSKKIKYILLSILTIVDVSSYGHFCAWRYYPSEKKIFNQPEIITEIKSDIKKENNRIWAINGIDGLFGAYEIKPPSLAELPGKISELWQISNISGYNPMILKRYSKLTSIDGSGEPSGELSTTNLAYNLLSTKYIIINKNNPNGYLTKKGMPEIILTKNQEKVEIPIAKEKITTINIISSLSNSVEIPENFDVAYIKITTTDDKIYEYSIKAGRDTSEVAWERNDVQTEIKHGLAKIYSNIEAADEKNNIFLCHLYEGNIELNKTLEIKNIEIIRNKKCENMEPNMELRINGIKLINNENGKKYSLGAFNALISNGGWKYIKDVKEISIYENTKLMPRAWLVPNVSTLKPAEILNTIQNGKFSDGKAFDPSVLGLIEEPCSISQENSSQPNGRIDNLNIEEENVSLTTSTKKEEFLILSDIYYPGWKAYIDGKETKIYQTDYILRGIVVPAGEHTVEFAFEPASLYLGGTISILSILLSFLIII